MIVLTISLLTTIGANHARMRPSESECLWAQEAEEET